MWITFYFCGKVWCNVDNFVDRMWITSLFLNLFEIKQNELNTHVCIIYLGRSDIHIPIFVRQDRFWSKIFYTFGQCVIFKNPYNPGVFYISKKSALAARRGMCSTQASHSNSNLPTTSLNYQKSHPKYPKIARELLRRTFEKSFIFNQLQLPKNPPIPSNHPKIPPKNHKTPNKINSFSNKVQ